MQSVISLAGNPLLRTSYLIDGYHRVTAFLFRTLMFSIKSGHSADVLFFLYPVPQNDLEYVKI